MKIFSVPLLALILLCSQNAAADGPVTREMADKYCHAFIDTPEKFKKLACDAKAVPEKESTFCFAHAVLGSAEIKKFSYGADTGTCHSSPLVLVTPEGQKDLQPLNASGDGYSMGAADQPLDFDGNLFITNQSQSDLRIVTSEGAVVLCGIKNKFNSWQVNTKETSKTCVAFAENNFHHTDHAAEESDTLLSNPQTQDVVAVSEADLDADGKSENILTFESASSAGCGCISRHLELDKRTLRENDAGLDKALLALTNKGCLDGTAYKWSAIEISGRAYIANLPDNTPSFSNTPYENASLYEYQDGAFKKVCNLVPEVTRVIDRDVLPATKLNYIPVE